MTWPYILVAAAVLAFAIWLAVNDFRRRAAVVHRRGRAGPPAAYDVDDAVAWVGRRVALPPELDVAGLRRVLGWTAECLRTKQTSPNGHGSDGSGWLPPNAVEVADHVLGRAEAAGMELPVEAVYDIIEANEAYLRTL